MKTTIMEYNKGRIVGGLTIEAPNKDELLALYFREYHNRFKYHNDIGYRIKDKIVQQEFYDWMSTVSNHASNGGDMW